MMPTKLNRSSDPIEFVSSTLRRRALIRQDGWDVNELLCTAGPADRPYQEQHPQIAIGFVAEGTFEYRSDSGDAILYPGSFLLGNADACFQCNHRHSTGDRCVAFEIERELFAEIAASVNGSSRFRFRTAMLPARGRLVREALRVETMTATGNPTEESVYALVESLIGALSASPRHHPRLAPADARRVAAALRFVQRHSNAPIDLGSLAKRAAMSKYHFLRTFRHATGTTPYQYVLTTRLHRAAKALISTRLPVAMIAADAGFGDLSTFNRMFRSIVGVTPTKLRAQSQGTDGVTVAVR